MTPEEYINLHHSESHSQPLLTPTPFGNGSLLCGTTIDGEYIHLYKSHHLFHLVIFNPDCDELVRYSLLDTVKLDVIKLFISVITEQSSYMFVKAIMETFGITLKMNNPIDNPKSHLNQFPTACDFPPSTPAPSHLRFTTDDLFASINMLRNMCVPSKTIELLNASLRNAKPEHRYSIYSSQFDTTFNMLTTDGYEQATELGSYRHLFSFAHSSIEIITKHLEKHVVDFKYSSTAADKIVVCEDIDAMLNRLIAINEAPNELCNIAIAEDFKANLFHIIRNQ
ncbi:hypothetical protein [Photobacterium damselae]|uniref:hypothetical protein n=1 Tax=Photobacterium damselae TaxID=38293 RepID=UPI001F3519C5|nr:hypothetical protein [Photobacterium damselae]UKA04751.1 hypothetical protein IHC89_21150 [Photobacterium damselae subsp. damselae]